MNRLIILLILFLPACSTFRPLYGADFQSQDKLRKIEVVETGSMHGSEIYHHLSNLFRPSGDSLYLLRIEIATDNSHPLAISGHSELVKQKIAQQYSYSLVDKSDGKILDNGTIRMIGSYNATENPFHSYMSEKFTRKSLAQNLSEEIHMRLLLYFSSN